MGKPLGLGSVAINYELQLSDRNQRYQHLFDDEGNWNEGFLADDVVATYQGKALAQFEAFIVRELKKVDPEINSIDDLDQIKELKALLEWRKGKGLKFDGFINNELSSALRYMEIARNGLSRLEDKPNEYSSRRILPLPTQVNSDSIQAIKKYPKVLEEDDEIQVKIVEVHKENGLITSALGLIDGVNQKDGFAIIEQENLYRKKYEENHQAIWIIIRIEKRGNKTIYFCKPKNK